MFVPYGHFQDRNPERFHVAPREVGTIYMNSRVVNNYTIVNKTTFINEGIGRQRVMAVTHQPIQPVSIHHVTGTGYERKLERLDGASRTLSVYHPPQVNTTATRNSPAAPNTPFMVNRAPQRMGVGAPEAGRTATVSGSPGRTEVPHNARTESRSGSVTVHRPADVKDTHMKIETTPSAHAAGSDHPTPRINPSHPATTVTRPTITEPARPVNPQNTHPTPVQPERFATPQAPSRATPPQSVHSVAQPAATHPAVTTPARSETPAPMTRPAAQENPKPVFTPRNDSPNRSPADSGGAIPKRSNALPAPSTSPSSSDPNRIPSPGSSHSGSSGRYGNGNRTGN